MNKNEYICALARLIQNRVRFHAPIVYGSDVDFQLLEIVGIDKNLPIFKLDKPLNKLMFRAFVKAQKEVDFNLVLTDETIKKSWKNRLKNLYILDRDCVSYGLVALINKLNINYISHSTFQQGLNTPYCKVNGGLINLAYKKFYLHKKAEADGVVYEIKEFVLNGKNYSCSFANPHFDKRQISLELNIPLPSGYYFFSNTKTGIKIENLTNGDCGYFNYCAKDAQLSFSAIDGLTSSTRACINIKLNVQLSGKQTRTFYFNYGKQAYLLKNQAEQKQFFDISQHKAFSLFDTLISSRDKAFDEQFNNVLPQKIWTAWANFTCDEQSEKQYLLLKNSLAKKYNNGYIISDKHNLREVKLYIDGQYKRVFIVEGQQRFIKSGKTRFINFSLVDRDFFKQTSEIYLCFGK